MKTRAQAAEWWNSILKDGQRHLYPDDYPNWAWGYNHIGRVEIRAFMDFLYDGPPADKSEEIKKLSEQ